MRRLLLPFLLASSATVDAIKVDDVVLPKINLGALGSIGLVGEYDGISTYNYKGQQNSTATKDGDMLYAQVKDKFLPQQQLDGDVMDMCKINDMVYFAGKFTKVGNTKAKNIASINTTSGDISALDDAPKNGSIQAVYCDEDKKLVYVGGSFTFNETQGVALYDSDKKKWQSPIFGGFENDSSVNSITNYGDSIVFAGSFSNLANDSYTGSSNSKKGFAQIAKRQRVSFSAAKITAEGTEGNTDPKTITCSDSKGWKLTDGRAGTWRADFPFYFTPTRMRLHNYDGDDGVKHLHFRAFPLNGILNMTYVDGDSKENKTCNADCQLPASKDKKYVDFLFPNDVKMNGFQIDLLDFYGKAAGLGEIELFSSDIITYAQDDLNKPQSCEKAGKGGSAKTKGDGWNHKSYDQETYLTTTVTDAAKLKDTEVLFEPNITVYGNYSVQLYTPGCVGDGSCGQRGRVNVSLYYDPKKDPIITELAQTNNDQKYDTLYTGPVRPVKGDYRPKVVVQPIVPQNVPLSFAAQRVQFVYQMTEKDKKEQEKIKNGKTGDDNDDDDDDDDKDYFDGDFGDGETDLNGLFELNYDNFTKIDENNSSYVPVGNTSVNGLFSGAKDVHVKAIANIDNKLVVGGQFTAEHGESVAVLDDDDIVKVSGGGLNGVVDHIVDAGRKAFMLGSFNSTKDNKTELKYVAIYDPSKNEWKSLGKKFDSKPDSMAVLMLNGTETVTFSGPGSKFNVWVVDEEKWLEDSKLSHVYIKGHISSSYTYGKDNTLFSGSVRLLQSTSPGGSFLSNDYELSPMPFKLETISSANYTNSSSQKNKRDSAVSQIQQTLNGNSINVGAFANKSTSILGGHFRAKNNDGDTFENLLIMNDDNVTGLQKDDTSSDSVVYSLLVDKNDLYIGGDVKNKDNSVGGLMFYDLSKNEMKKDQPPPLNGGQGTVTALLMHPKTRDLVVMGSFEQAGSLGCNAFCVYDLKQSRWNNPSGGGISGTVSSAIFIGNDEMFFAGDMKLNGTKAYFAKYDFGTGAYTSMEKMSKDLPGPVNSFVLNGDGDKSTSMFASGTDTSAGKSYLAHWDDKNWKRLDKNFEKGTSVTDLKLVELKQGHKDNDVLPKNQLLIVSGNLVLKEFGNVSSVMYDGKNWQPLFLTSNGKNSGAVNALFSQTDQEFGSILGQNHMARGFVVLISLAIAVGLVLLLVGLGLLVSYWRKRRQGYRPAPSRVSEVDMTETVPPANLFEELGNANGTKSPHLR